MIATPRVRRTPERCRQLAPTGRLACGAGQRGSHGKIGAQSLGPRPRVGVFGPYQPDPHRKIPATNTNFLPKAVSRPGRQQGGDPTRGDDKVITLSDLTIEEIKFLEFLDLISALPAERRQGLLTMLQIFVERQRAEGAALELAFDG